MLPTFDPSQAHEQTEKTRLSEGVAVAGRDSTGSNVLGVSGVGLGPKEVDRVKLVRERQQEERQRKLDELRQQALAAQRFREQREEDRRRRIEELRTKDYDRYFCFSIWYR